MLLRNLVLHIMNWKTFSVCFSKLFFGLFGLVVSGWIRLPRPYIGSQRVRAFVFTVSLYIYIYMTYPLDWVNLSFVLR
jgi:hypothetical protein